MKRKLLLLNVVLGVIAIYGAWQLRRTWKAEKARETATLNQKVPPAAPPPYASPPRSAPVVAGGYLQIVQKTLFDRSRNPEVPVELPPPEPPKPQKPMPRLPQYHGQMNFGDGPIVVMSEDTNMPHQAVRVGEKIGQFTLAGVNTEEITLEWEGQTVKKKLEELRDRQAEQQQAVANAPVAVAAARTETPAPKAEAAPLPPGVDTGGGYRACQPNDSNPAGAVVDGYRKVVIPNPFGQMCRWEPAR